MASARTICTECRQPVTLPEPAEVGDVVACPKCEAYFTVPRTKIVPTPGAAKPTAATPARPVAALPAKPKAVAAVLPAKKKPVVVVEEEEEEDDEEEEERPKKKKRSSDDGGPRKKKRKKRKDENEGGFRNSPLRFVILGVLVVVMLVLAYFLYKKMKEPPPPDIIIKSTIDDFSQPITKAEIDAAAAKGGKAKGNSPKSGLATVDRLKATTDLTQLGKAYHSYVDANGRGPSKPADLAALVENRDTLIKDMTDAIYVIVMDVRPAQLPGGSSNTILGYVHDVPQKGGVALFADASVRQVTKAEFDAAPKAGK